MFTTPSRKFLFVSTASFIDFTLDEKMQYKTKQKKALLESFKCWIAILNSNC
jgi:hypothetical protein